MASSILKRSSVKINAPTQSKTAIRLTTLEDYIGAMIKYAGSQPLFKCYRGQCNSAWANIPALFRPDLAKLAKSEKRAVRDLVSIHPSEFSDDETMFDRLVRMQHFGLPSRLMDVSQNPLVALYFATQPAPQGQESDGAVTAFAIPEEREKYFDSDAVSCLANLSNMTAQEKDEIIELRTLRLKGTTKDAEIARVNAENVYRRLHQFIRSEKPHFLPIIDPIDLFKPYYVHPKMSNRRILSQAGGFIIHGLAPKKINFAHPIEETKFVIPMDAKKPLRNALELIGISDSTLFPELDRAANRIKAAYSS